MPLRDTLLPLVLAPFGAVLVLSVSRSVPPSGSYLAIVFLFGYAFALGAAVVLVLPVLALFPRLRRPSLWIAAVWGASVALIATSLVFGASQIFRWEVAAGFGSAGAAAGLVYAVAVRIPALMSAAVSRDR